MLGTSLQEVLHASAVVWMTVRLEADDWAPLLQVFRLQSSDE